ncbi:MAG: FAD-binding domain-containing protein [Saprospiraceae bacterium]
MHSSPAVYWLKRDFRLADNPALSAALAAHERVCVLYVVEEAWLTAPQTSAFHVHAVTGALADLRRRLAHHAGADVLVLRGGARETLERMHDALPFTHLYSHEEVGVNWTYQRDEVVRAWCRERGVTWTEERQTGVFRAFGDRDKRHLLWKKFTLAPLLPVPTNADLARLVRPEVWCALDERSDAPFTLADTAYELSEGQRKHVQPVSETDAEETLRSFLYERGLGYRGGISSPLTAFEAGSRLSVHLAWGTLTGRRAYQAALARKEELKQSEAEDAGRWRSSLTAFQSRLHWRDHFIQRLETEPQIEFEPLNKAYEALEYKDDPVDYEAWKTGHTGFPLVDACIRCLLGSGFVNFRMRAMLTSIACHTLHLHWKSLDFPMARMYTDYEPGIHLSQLQMQASVVGINTVRMYSPHKQIIDQDPEAVFIKEWVPELREFAAKQIQEHRREPLGDYPGQTVDWWESSRAMRDKIWAIKKLPATKEEAQRVYDKHGSRRSGPKKKKTAAKKSDKVTPEK